MIPSGLIDPIAQYDTHLEGHSVIIGFVYRGRQLHELRGHLVFGDFSRLFNFPSGPHNYGRLFHINAESRGGQLQKIREFHITPSNAPNSRCLASARTRMARSMCSATSAECRLVRAG